MSIVKITRMPLEEVRRLLEAGFKISIISEQSGYPPSAVSIMATVWGLQRKRGRVPKPKAVKQ